MDELSFICRNCNHVLRFHQLTTFGIWYCDAIDEKCSCINFERKHATGTDGDEIEVNYDSESYRWN